MTSSSLQHGGNRHPPRRVAFTAAAFLHRSGSGLAVGLGRQPLVREAPAQLAGATRHWRQILPDRRRGSRWRGIPTSPASTLRAAARDPRSDAGGTDDGRARPRRRASWKSCFVSAHECRMQNAKCRMTPLNFAFCILHFAFAFRLSAFCLLPSAFRHSASLPSPSSWPDSRTRPTSLPAFRGSCISAAAMSSSTPVQLRPTDSARRRVRISATKSDR